MRKIVLLTLALLSMEACTDENASQRTLESAGFTEIHFTGHRMFACGEDDTYATGFRATNPLGRRVSGTVCCGLWSKDCTIRF